MPKGWSEPERKITVVEKKEKEEMDKILDYYYEVVKPAANDPNVSEEEREKLRAQYWKMKNDKEAQIIAQKLGIQDGEVKTLDDLLKNKVYKERVKEVEEMDKQMIKEWERKANPSSSSSSSSKPPRRSSSSSSGNAKSWLWIICFFGGFILVIHTIVTLNIYSMIFGFILFAIGVGWISWLQGSHEAKHGHHGNGSGGFYANRWGSYNAKRNMWRGHWYSRRR
jgi:hypothetical protein